MVIRQDHLEALRGALERHPVVAILGPRQVGKTTLAHQLAGEEDQATVFDLEDPEDRARLQEPKLALESLRGLVVLDEIQRMPEVFQILRVLVDRPARPNRFLVLGSASPDLLRQSSETLAGRIHFYRLDGFDLDEVGFDELERLWVRGSFPRSYLAASDADSDEWRRDFIQTFLERDLPQLGIQIPSQALRRFWTMVAHYHGQTWNGSEIGRSFGVSHTTVGRYLDLLTATYVLRSLQPWPENLKKRQVRSPKVYIADSGLLHTLLGIEDRHDLLGHPKLGASWEGFVIRAVIRQLRAREEQCYFWATHAGAELDLLIVRGRHRRGFEVKHTVSPKVTPSMRTAFGDLSLDRLDVIHAGSHSFQLDEHIHAVACSRLATDLPALTAKR